MRYIDADALLSKLPEDLPYKASVKRVLIQVPTADVVEVRHGYWETRYSKHIDHLGEFLKYDGDFCSICGTLGYGKYCFECGAKMDGERNENGKS